MSNLNGFYIVCWFRNKMAGQNRILEYNDEWKAFINHNNNSSMDKLQQLKNNGFAPLDDVLVKDKAVEKYLHKLVPCPSTTVQLELCESNFAGLGVKAVEFIPR